MMYSDSFLGVISVVPFWMIFIVTIAILWLIFLAIYFHSDLFGKK